MRYTSIQQVRQPGPKGETSPQKPTRPPKYTATRRTANPTRQKASGETTGNHQETGFRTTRPKPSVLQPSSDPARTPLYSTGVCQATPRAFPPLYAGPPNGPGHGKLGHEICKQNSPGRSSDSLNPTAPSRCQPPTINHQLTANHQPSTANHQSPTNHRNYQKGASHHGNRSPSPGQSPLLPPPPPHPRHHRRRPPQHDAGQPPDAVAVSPPLLEAAALRRAAWRRGRASSATLTGRSSPGYHI